MSHRNIEKITSQEQYGGINWEAVNLYNLCDIKSFTGCDCSFYFCRPPIGSLRRGSVQRRAFIFEILDEI